mmetsp:Transcript_10978/g.27650  ORF Transcript_10978/g.27650 Transcript_10978/m.27650 type:complete len:275 (+) Transcript_10978:553-1377(+)
MIQFDHDSLDILLVDRALMAPKSLPQLVNRYRLTVVSVVHGKRFSKLFSCNQLGLFLACRNEFFIREPPISIDVVRLEDCLRFLFSQVITQPLGSHFHLAVFNSAIPVQIEFFKGPLQLIQSSRIREFGNFEKRSFLELVHQLKLDEILLQYFDEIQWGSRRHAGEPRILQKLFYGSPPVRIHNKYLPNERLRLLRDLIPGLGPQVIVPTGDAQHYAFLRVANKGKPTREHEIKNAAYRPNIAFLVGTLLESFRGHVARGAEDVLEVLPVGGFL